MPIRRDAAVVGQVAGVLLEKDIRHLTVSSAYGSEAYSFVCDGDGNVIIRPSDSERALAVDNILTAFSGGDAAYGKLAADIKNGTNGKTQVTLDGEEQLMVYRDTGVNGWMLCNVVPGSVIQNTVQESKDMAYGITITVALLSILLLLAVLLGDRRRRRQLENEREDLHAAVEQSGRFVLRYDLKRDAAHLIGEKWRVFGYRDTWIKNFPERLIRDGQLSEESAQVVREFFAAIRTGTPPKNCDVQLPGPAGERWYHLDGTIVGRAPVLRARHAIMSLFDNTDLREKEQAYEHWRGNLSGMVENSVCYIEANLTRDKIERIDGIYASAEQRLGLEEPDILSALIRMDAERNVHEDDRVAYEHFFDRRRLFSLFAKGGHADSLEFRSRFGGQQEWHRCVLQMAKYPYSEEIKIFMVFTNINSERSRLERLSDLATRDSITHLLNREATESRIRAWLATADVTEPCAMFMIDLDNFKQVNDIKGHLAGDLTLRDIAGAIGGVFRKNDIVGRVGGDEFMVFLTKGVSRAMVEQKTAALLEALQFSVSDMLVTASIGATISRGGEKLFEQLYAEADMALYHAKNRGKNQSCIVDAGGECVPLSTAPDSADSVQFKTLLENMDGGVLLARVGEEITITYVSPSFFRFTNRREDELGGRNDMLFSLVYPEDLPLVHETLREAADGKLGDCTYRVGEAGAVWRHLRVAPIKDAAADGDPTVIGVITDVTELKNSEKQRDIAMERYRIAVKHIGGLMWEVDIPARTLYISLDAAQSRGTEQTVFPDAPESLLAEGMVHPDSAADYRRLFDDVYAGRESGEYALLSRDVKLGYAWNKASFELLHDENGMAYRAIGVSERITNIDAEMRTFAEEARFAEQIADHVYAAAQVNLSRGVVEQIRAPGVFDPETKTAVEGIRQASALVAWCLERVTDMEERADGMRTLQPEALMDSFRRGNRWIAMELRRNAHNGTARWTSVAINMIRHPVSGEIHLFLYLRDINDRKRWEQAYAGPVALDPQMWLYTEDTFRQMTASILTEQRTRDAACSLAVMEIMGLDRLVARTSSREMGDALFTLGRLARIMTRGDVIIGRLSDTRIALFRIEPLHDETVGDRLTDVRARIAGVLQHTFHGDLTLSIGYDVEDCRHASIDTMCRHAAAACFVAGHDGTDYPVVRYSQEDTPALSDGTPSNRQTGRGIPC